MKFLSHLILAFLLFWFSAPLVVSQTSFSPILSGTPASKGHQDETVEESMIDYPSFNDLTHEVDKYRAKRLISIETFFEYASYPNTIILDTRSVGAFQGRHIEGAINLPFSDFTEVSLKKMIGDKSTRILIYCNNNFMNDPVFMRMKAPPLALNIPTFINLYGYGYKNIYELNGRIDVGDDRIITRWKAEPDSPLAKMYKTRSGKK